MRRTNIDDIAASARIEVQRRVACRAVLRLELADELVKASFVGHVGAGELQHALAAERVLQGLLAHGALAADEGPLAARATAVGGGGHDVVVRGGDST